LVEQRTENPCVAGSIPVLANLFISIQETMAAIAPHANPFNQVSFFTNAVKSTLCKMAAVALLVASVAFLLYLRTSVPVDYVWPGITKLTHAALPIFGGLGLSAYLFALSEQYSKLA
jgi:hypothetical protein